MTRSIKSIRYETLYLWDDATRAAATDVTRIADLLRASQRAPSDFEARLLFRYIGRLDVWADMLSNNDYETFGRLAINRWKGTLTPADDDLYHHLELTITSGGKS